MKLKKNISVTVYNGIGYTEYYLRLPNSYKYLNNELNNFVLTKLIRKELNKK